MRRPQMLDLPRPRREEYTICTAVAPEDAFTVRTYGDTRTHYGQAPPASAQIPRRSRPNVQVRKLQPAKPRNADKSRAKCVAGQDELAKRRISEALLQD
jgi:hypothetical protein